MGIPTNREDFSSYCLRKLGQPLVQVNVAVEQVEDRIDEALYKYYERNYQAVEEVFIIQDITTPEKTYDSNGDAITDSNGDFVYTTNTDTEAGFLQLPNDIVGVTDVFRPAISGGIAGGGANWEFYVNDIYRTLVPHGSMPGGMSYYYMYQSQLSLINRYFNPERQYEFNPITNKLIVAGGLKDSDNRYGGLIIRAFRKIHGETDSNTPVGAPTGNVWSNKWLQDYCSALIEYQWGMNLGKYQQVQLLGGVTMNGEQIILRAQEKINKLEEQLQLEYELPPGFFLG